MADRNCSKTCLPLAKSSSTPSWWEFHHQATCSTTSTTKSSWNSTAASFPLIVYENCNNSKSSPCDHEDASFTVSNQSTLTVDEHFHQLVEPSSSSNNMITDPVDYNSNLWSQFLLGVEGRQKMQGEVSDEVGEKLVKALSLKSFSHGMFEPLACSDYLQKFDTHQHEKWDENNGDQYSNHDTNKLLRTYPGNDRSSDPPDGPPINQTKQNFAYQQQLCSMGTSSWNSDFDSQSYVFNHTRTEDYIREENGQADPNLGALFHRGSNIGNQNGSTPSLLKSLSFLETRNQQRTTIQGIKGQPPASTNDRKKKRSNDLPQSSSSLKKLKHESNSSSASTTSSSAKARDTTQTPKVKISAEKISALQQIVSPFGKTDTASVLQEAIGFIKCHQEQVQLLSNRYLKSSVNKLQEAWRGMDRKVLGLKSKGLCLFPTSNIPHVYIENAGPDYWPAYRGCMFR